MEFVCCHLRSKNATKEMVCFKCNENYHTKCIFPDKPEKWVPDKQLLSSWLCPKCSRSSQRDNRDDTPVRAGNKTCIANARNDTSPSHQNVTLRKNSVAPRKEELISISKETLRSIIKEEINAALCNTNSTLMELKTEVAELQNSLKFMSEKYDSVIKRISCVEEKTKTINTLELEVKDLKIQLKTINCSIEKQEQWGRRSNIEIVGLPERKEEDLMNALCKLATFAKCSFNPQADIDFVTRVAHMNKDIKKPRPVVVRFLARYKKDEFLSRLKACKDLKACDIGFSNNTSRIYFNEHLTSERKILLKKVKKAAEEKQYKYVWVKNYAILARKNDHSAAIHISTEGDLKKLV